MRVCMPQDVESMHGSCASSVELHCGEPQFWLVCRCGKLCLEELRWLTKVKRFSVAMMFLSRKEKEGNVKYEVQG